MSYMHHHFSRVTGCEIQQDEPGKASFPLLSCPPCPKPDNGQVSAGDPQRAEKYYPTIAEIPRDGEWYDVSHNDRREWARWGGGILIRDQRKHETKPEPLQTAIPSFYDDKRPIVAELCRAYDESDHPKGGAFLVRIVHERGDLHQWSDTLIQWVTNHIRNGIPPALCE